MKFPDKEGIRQWMVLVIVDEKWELGLEHHSGDALFAFPLTLEWIPASVEEETIAFDDRYGICEKDNPCSAPIRIEKSRHVRHELSHHLLRFEMLVDGGVEGKQGFHRTSPSFNAIEEASTIDCRCRDTCQARCDAKIMVRKKSARSLVEKLDHPDDPILSRNHRNAQRVADRSISNGRFVAEFGAKISSRPMGIGAGGSGVGSLRVDMIQLQVPIQDRINMDSIGPNYFGAMKRDIV